MNKNIDSVDLEIMILEQKLKIARIQNESLKQQLNALDNINEHMEESIKTRNREIFWNEITRDVIYAMYVHHTPSQTDIVSSAYINCTYEDLEHIGLVNSDYFAIAN
jgi:hypothetical protein